MIELMPNIDTNSDVPIYVQLYKYIKQEIISGHIQPMTRLPSIRKLASFLKISRTTIEATYHQLCVEGYIISKPKSGYYVNNIETSIAGVGGTKVENDSQSETDNHSIFYNLADERVDNSAFDFRLWKRYINRVINVYHDRLLTYGEHQGEYELRKEINKYVFQFRGVTCSENQIVVGAGIQSLLNILCVLVKYYYKEIAFEDPSFKKARHIFKDHGFKIIPIPLEHDGIDVDMLDRLDVQLVYVSPSHQFPTGSIMPVNKRIKLLNWAYNNNALIIEDDYDSELMYYGRPVPSLQGIDNGENVVYLGSFSKIMMPSMRVSYMILPNYLLDIYKKLKYRYNQSSSKLEQLALMLFMRDGMMEKHIRKVRKMYAKKNQILIKTLQETMKDNIRIIGHHTGLHMLLEVKCNISSDQLAHAAQNQGVKVIPVSDYMIKPRMTGNPLILLAYGGISIEQIPDAVRALYTAWIPYI